MGHIPLSGLSSRLHYAYCTNLVKAPMQVDLKATNDTKRRVSEMLIVIGKVALTFGRSRPVLDNQSDTGTTGSPFRSILLSVFGRSVRKSLTNHKLF